MKKIIIFYDGSFYTFKWLKSLIWCKKELEEFGYKIKFSNVCEYLPIKNGLESLKKYNPKKDVDYILLAFHRKRYVNQYSLEEITNILLSLKQKCNKLIWMDTSDSTGTTQFELMPYVDLYFKKQYLTDKSRYFFPIWGGRTYAQYYHDSFGASSDGIDGINFMTLKDEDLSKLRLSWNVGMGDLFANKYESYAFPGSIKKPTFISPKDKDGFDIFYRGTKWPSAVGYQRALTINAVNSLDKLTHPNPSERVDPKTYKQELSQSKMAISPFGWGEICSRDFEAFAYGSLLIKPSMDHLETFPNWYIPDVTYKLINWDFSDVKEVLEQISEKEMLSIAENAQNSFKKIRKDKLGFAKHFISEIER